MAWTKVEEIKGRKFTLSANAQSATKAYIAVSDSNITEIDDVLAADDGSTAIPTIGDSYNGTRTNLQVVDVSPKAASDGNLLVFYVTVDYVTPENSNTIIEDPTARDWEVSTQTVAVDVNVATAKVTVVGLGTVNDVLLSSGDGLVNSAQAPIPAKDARLLTRLTLVKNYSTWTSIHASITDYSDLRAYENKINSASVTITDVAGAKWAWLIESIPCVNAYESGTAFVRVTYNILYDPDTHARNFLNAGTVELKPGPPKTQEAIQFKGKPITKPIPLDKNGAKFDPNTFTPSDASYTWAILKEEVSFANLGLPTAFIQ